MSTQSYQTHEMSYCAISGQNRTGERSYANVIICKFHRETTIQHQQAHAPLLCIKLRFCMFRSWAQKTNRIAAFRILCCHTSGRHGIEYPDACPSWESPSPPSPSRWQGESECLMSSTVAPDPSASQQTKHGYESPIRVNQRDREKANDATDGLRSSIGDLII